jgi:hypothetical protein
VAARRTSHPCSAGLALELFDDGGEELDDSVLLTTRELGDLVEEFSDFADGAAAARDERGGLGGGREEELDGNVEGFGELGEDVGARGFVGLLPEGDDLLFLADEATELGLGEAGAVAESGEVGALGRSRLSELPSHSPRVEAVFDFHGDRGRSGLH